METECITIGLTEFYVDGFGHFFLRYWVIGIHIRNQNFYPSMKDFWIFIQVNDDDDDVMIFKILLTNTIFIL